MMIYYKVNDFWEDGLSLWAKFLRVAMQILGLNHLHVEKQLLHHEFYTACRPRIINVISHQHDNLKYDHA